ncbi:hypothetical protein [Microlunatus flavus]|uniref:Tryptophan-associated transmembrane protein (Trp_oprn_chp) n=1 Tax=Microlunatus flavus TaxID=1036181 RepID=A0A1H9F4G2_9ACTN|nr:hypothetical protein [Microlunatus flavus]SEQ32118.1 hypothetical protein SAMN05421756_103128 [Microlunatus flavus]
MPARFSTSSGAGRPTGVRVALVVAVVGVLLVLGAVLAPVLGVIGSADGASAGALDVPVGRIVGVGLLGLVLVLGLGAGLVRTLRTPVAWALTVLVVVITLVASVYPLLSTASAALEQGRDFVPWVTGLVAQLRG